MQILRIGLFCTMILCAPVVSAELVAWLKDDVKALMPYEDFPTVDEAVGIIPENDPLVNQKRTDVLHTLINLTDFYPIFEEGKWQDLAKSYKQAFNQLGVRYPFRDDDRALLDQEGFKAYPLVMQTFFPEAFKLKPSSDGSHKQEAALGTAENILAALLALIVLAIAIRMFTRR